MLDKCLQYALMPVFYLQGIKVKRSIPTLPEPIGSRQGLSGTGKPLKLLVIGDSAAAGVGVKHQQAALLGNLVDNLKVHNRVNWKLHAKTGATTLDIIKDIDNLEEQQLDVIVTSLGVNDVTSGISAKKWLARQLQLRNKLVSKFNPKLLVLSSLPPMGEITALPQPLRWYVGDRARTFDRLLKQSCQGITKYLPVKIGKISEMLAADGFHPSARLYKTWGEQVAKVIRERVD